MTYVAGRGSRVLGRELTRAAAEVKTRRCPVAGDRATSVARARWTNALKNCDEDEAVAAARELVRLRRRRQIEQKERELAELRRQDEPEVSS